ncbi:MAG: phosphate acyltransferase PlsX [Acidobacteriota bacterium]|nr:phosphate acyltransferase PlsX [Acidobacteriota bacterium]
MGPREVAAGAALAAERGVRVLLFGPAREIGSVPAGMELIDAPLSIAKSADPARAVRAAPDSSIVQAARAVAGERAHALVCAGGTGAALAAGLFHIKRAGGIHRPALALALPVPGRAVPVTLIDVGANTEARPEHLVQFAFMGGAFASAVLGVGRPRVGLLANGSEAQRGGALVTAAREALAERLSSGGQPGPIELLGNVEGNTALAGDADVVVTDGLTGNIVLKLIEGVSAITLGAIRDAAMASPRARLGGFLMRPALRAFRAAADPEAQGGAYLLGLRSLVVVPHGRFSREGFAQAIVRARDGVAADVVGSTHAALQRAGALRRAPLAGGPAGVRVGR